MANVVIMTNYAWEQHGIACQMFLQQKRLFIFEITQALLQSNLAWSTFDWKLVKCCWCNVLNGSVAMPAKRLESDSDLLMPSLGANSKSVSWVSGEDVFLDNLFLQTIPCCSLPNLHCQLLFQMPGVLLSCRESLGMWAPVLPPARLASCLDLPGNSRSSSYVGVFVKPYKRTLSPGRGQSRGTTCASIYNPTEAESNSGHSLAFNFDVSMVFIQRQNLILETAEPWRVVQFYLP